MGARTWLTGFDRALQLNVPRTKRRRFAVPRGIPQAKSITSDMKMKRLDTETHSEDVEERGCVLTTL